MVLTCNCLVYRFKNVSHPTSSKQQAAAAAAAAAARGDTCLSAKNMHFGSKPSKVLAWGLKLDNFRC